MGQPDVFISHCHHDKPLAVAIASLIDRSFRSAKLKIRATAVDGLNLRGGDLILPTVIQEAANCGVLILLVTEASMDSHWVLAELGACLSECFRTGTQKIIPMLCCGARPSLLPEPIGLMVPFNCDSIGLRGLVEAIGRILQLNPEIKLRSIANNLKKNPELTNEHTFHPETARPRCLKYFENRVEFHTSLEGTPWDLFALLKDPRWQKVWTISQNMGGFVSNTDNRKRFRREVIEALHHKSVGIMVSTPEMMLNDKENHFRWICKNRTIPFLQDLRKEVMEQDTLQPLLLAVCHDAAMLSGNITYGKNNDGVAIVNAKFTRAGPVGRTYTVFHERLNRSAYLHYRNELETAESRLQGHTYSDVPLAGKKYEPSDCKSIEGYI